MSMHQYCPVWAPVEGYHAGDELVVEPASGLIMCFQDQVCRPPLLQFERVLWISETGPRRGARIHPDVENVRFSICGSSTFALYLDLVDAVSMQFKLLWRV